MAEGAPAAGHNNDADRVLLCLIAVDQGVTDALITALLDLGITGATVVESKGMGAVLREEMPIFAGLASMLPRTTGSRLVLSVATRDDAKAVFNYITNELGAANKPLAFTVPLEDFLPPGR